MNGTIQLNSLDHYFAEFIKRQDSAPSDELWLAAALVSAESGQGHICLDLGSVSGRDIVPFLPSDSTLRVPEKAAWITALSVCNTVGKPGEYKPLILDDSGRLYLYRSWNYEKSVADSLILKTSGIAETANLPLDLLEKFFPTVMGSEDRQKAAAMAVLSGRLTVISGGPGTGKTSTVARILALLLEQGAGSGLQIALAAPTGKAASRLRQSILQSIQQLPLDGTIRAQMPHDVKTIHRLLGVVPGSSNFRYNKSNPLACDVLVVDEVSMVDLPLMSKLLDAVRHECRVILLGDQDQLASVEAGAVLADICNSDAENTRLCGPIAGAVVNLTKSYRFGDESGIGNLSRLVNAGAGDAAFEMLAGGLKADLVWKPLPPSRLFEEEFSSAVKTGYGEYVAAATPERALEILDEFRIISPYREGAYGVENLNRLALAALGLRKPEGQSVCNRMPVMVSGNNYELGLFNGDTAVLMQNETDKRLMACFEEPEGGIRHVSALRLPPFEPAFALTVHKSQGSEFDTVLLIIPEMDSEILTRELIYTAVTRAKKRVEIWCSRDIFCKAVERRIMRSSGLRERLWGV